MLHSLNKEYLLEDGRYITGTLVWYYSICKREVWLMAHEITPDEDFYSLEIGRAIHQIFYKEFRKEVGLEGARFDFLKKERNVVCEVKTSSRFLDAAILQLLYYLYRLKEYGIEAIGEIHVPKERKKIKVTLDGEHEARLLSALKEIRLIMSSTKPPEPVNTPFCRKCAYRDFCWG
jgi:CRISPR-associated exonuclease Cas4